MAKNAISICRSASTNSPLRMPVTMSSIARCTCDQLCGIGGQPVAALVEEEADHALGARAHRVGLEVAHERGGHAFEHGGQTPPVVALAPGGSHDAGEVAHVGTQFEVTLLDVHDRVWVRVREGQVALRGPAGQTALAGAGTELIARADGGVTRQSIATSGHDWAWVEALAPEFEIENRLLGDYLQWVSRETGRSLALDAGAQKQAATTRLHGSVHGLTVLDSLDAVLETSALHLDTPDGMIRVSSGREVPLAEKSK